MPPPSVYNRAAKLKEYQTAQQETNMNVTWHIRTLVTLLAILIHLPATAQEGEGLTIERLSDTIYVLFGDGGNIGVSAGPDGVFIIDDQLDGDGEMITKA